MNQSDATFVAELLGRMRRPDARAVCVKCHTPVEPALPGQAAAYLAPCSNCGPADVVDELEFYPMGGIVTRSTAGAAPSSFAEPTAGRAL